MTDDTRQAAETQRKMDKVDHDMATHPEKTAHQAEEVEGEDLEPEGADHQHGALGGSVTAVGGDSDSPGPGQTGTDRDRGFVGSANEDDAA